MAHRHSVRHFHEVGRLDELTFSCDGRMKFVHTFAKALRLLQNRIVCSRKAAEEGSDPAQYDFLRPPGRQVLWEKLERESQVFSMRGWACLQEKEANDLGAGVPEREIRRLCRTYANSTSTERASLRAKVSPALASSLHHFAWRMAVRALRTKSQEATRLGLVAIVIADMRIDMRETLGWLSLLYHAAVRIQSDAELDFQVAASMSSERTSDLINSFASSPPELRDISAFGFGEGTSEQGPTLVKIPL